MNLLDYGRDKRLRPAPGPYHQSRSLLALLRFGPLLRFRPIHLRPWIGLEAIVSDVANYSDNLQPGRIPLDHSQPDSLAQRISIAKRQAGQSLVDDRDLSCAFPI